MCEPCATARAKPSRRHPLPPHREEPQSERAVRTSRWAWPNALGVACCLIAFVAAGAIADRVFERVPHIEDEVAYLFQAQVFASGHLYVPAPSNRSCFFAPFILDHQGRRFAKYTPGWPALLAFGVRMGQPWWVNAACAALSVALTFRLGREVRGPPVGALASGLAATSPFLLILSGSMMSHTSCLVFVTAFLWCIWRSLRGGGDRWSLLAGVMLGCALLIRPLTGAAVGLPAGLWALSRLLWRGEWRRVWFLGLGFALVASLVPVTNAIWTGDPLLSPYTLFWPYDRLGFGPGHGPQPGGNTVWLGLSSAIASIGHLANRLHGWPALSLVFVVLGFLFRPRRQGDLFLVVTALALLLAHVLYWTADFVFGPRYVHETTSTLCVLSAAGIVSIGDWLRGKRRWLYAALLLLLAVDVLLYLPSQLQRTYGLYGITAAPREILRSAGLHDALVIVEDKAGWKDYAVAFSMNAPTLDGDIVFASECSPHTAELLADFRGRSVYYFDGQSVRPYSPSDEP